jgi:hypothetical protein
MTGGGISRQPLRKRTEEEGGFNKGTTMYVSEFQDFWVWILPVSWFIPLTKEITPPALLRNSAEDDGFQSLHFKYRTLSL